MAHDIAVIGISCRFPGAVDPAAYWRMLAGRGNGISEVPTSRWDVGRFYDPDPDLPGKANTRWGGFLSEPGGFDCDFFNMSEEEAVHVDPQQRLMLELGWEALEDAGIAPDSLRGSPAGVYVGISHNDYERIIYQSYERITKYHGTGSYQSVAANRISYFLNLVGPSMTLDTACSSSLTALHIACQALRLEPIPLALVGGVTLHLTPHETLGLTKGYMLSGQGHCKSFQPSGDGYVRGEGGGMLILKRLEDAVRDRNRIYGILKGSAVNHNGRSNGLSAPSALALGAVMQQALASAGVKPHGVSFLEAHGTGTRIGDQIELRAIKEVYEDVQEETLWLGCVKTNIGHLESASGMASLIKVLLALQHGQIPSNLHCEEVTQPAGKSGSRLRIPSANVAWPTGPVPRIAGVTTYGFAGANAHVIVQEAPEARPARARLGPGAHVLALSAQHPSALKELVRAYAALLEDIDESELETICHAANTGRSHFEWRAAFVADSSKLMAGLLHRAAQQDVVGSSAGRAVSSRIEFGAVDVPLPWEEFLSTFPPLQQVPDIQGPTSPPRSLPLQFTLGRLLADMGVGGARLDAESASAVLPDALIAIRLKTIEEPLQMLALHEDSPRLQLMRALAAAYEKGVRLKWHALYGSVGVHPNRRLPTYPFQRRKHWFELAKTPQSAVDYV